MHPYFICNPDQIQTKLNSLKKTGTSVEGWTRFYRDMETNEEWLLTSYESELQGGGVSVLKRLPVPSIDELIDIAMTSADQNDIIGASLELSERERFWKEDFRQKLLNRLLQVDKFNLSDFEKERLKLIIYESDLYDETNRRTIVGKHYSEIQTDAAYYRSVAQRAKALLKEIGR